MRVIEFVPAAFLVLVAAFVYLGTSGLNLWDGITPGARFFPVVLTVASVTAAAALVLAQLRGIERVEPDLPDASGAGRVALTLLALLALAVLAPRIGMVPVIAVFMLFMLLVVLRQRLAPSIGTAAFITLAIELVFVRWLSVPLPAQNLF